MAPKLPASRRRNGLVTVTALLRPQNVLAYGRVSTDVQRDTESIKIQVHKLEGMIAVRSNPDLPMRDQLKLIESFWDDGVSGTIPLEKRPEGRRLVGLICSRSDMDCDGSCFTTSEIDQVWITKLDRLARKLQILIDIEAFLRRHHIALVCLDPTIDTSTPTGRLVFTILASIADWERETILERTVDGKHTKASEGKSVGGRQAYGLVTDENGFLQLDTTFDEGLGMMRYEIVRSVFENIALHGSTAWREAKRIGITDRRLGWMLHNRRYKGEGGILDGEGNWTEATKNKPPQIVTPEVWELAQTVLQSNRKNSSRNRNYDYLLSGLMYCHEPFDQGICNRLFTGRTESRHKYQANYTYYYCSRSMKQPNSPSQMGCTAKMVRAEDAEAAVWEEVKAAVRNPQAYLDRLDDGRGEQLRQQLEHELRDLEEQLLRAAHEKEMTLRSGESGVRPYDEAVARAREIMAQAEGLTDRRTAIELQLRSMSIDQIEQHAAAITAADIAEKLDEIDATNDRKRKSALIHQVVKTIEVRTVEGAPRLRVVLRLGLEVDLSALPMAPRLGPQAQDHREDIEVVSEIKLPSRRRCAA